VRAAALRGRWPFPDGADGLYLVEAIEVDAQRAAPEQILALLDGVLDSLLHGHSRVVAYRLEGFVHALADAGPAALSEIEQFVVVGDGEHAARLWWIVPSGRMQCTECRN